MPFAIGIANLCLTAMQWLCLLNQQPTRIVPLPTVWITYLFKTQHSFIPQFYAFEAEIVFSNIQSFI